MGASARQNSDARVNKDLYVGAKATGTITCPAPDDLPASGDYLTVGDGTNTVKLEPRSKAQIAVTLKALAEITDNMTVSLDDGTNDPTVQEAQVTDPPVAATGSITCPAPSALADGAYVTVSDGTHAAQKFEPRAKATGTITCVAKANLKNNETVTVSDGTNTATVFKFHTAAAAAATGTVTEVAKANHLNNETLTISDGTNTPTVFKYHVAAAAAATGSITCETFANVTDGDTIAIGDGTHTVVLEFDKTGNGVTEGNVALDVSGCTTAQTVAVVVAGQINSIGAGLTITAGTPTDGTFDLTADTEDYAHNVTITKTGTSCSVTGMSGGVTAFSAGGAVELDITAATDAASCATILYTAINGVTTTLTVTAAEPSTAVVSLTADTQDYTHNVAITHTVADAGFAVTGMAGGVTAFSAGGATEVDIIGSTTAPQVATVLYGVINGVTTGLTVTAAEPTDAVVHLTNDATGSVGNVAITETVTDAGFTVTGMSTGLGAASPVAGGVVADVTGVSTAAGVAAIVRTAINATTGASFTIAAGTLVGAQIPLTNSVAGVVGNVAITQTGTTALTLAGMSGGVAGFVATGGAVRIVDLRTATTDTEAAQAFVDDANSVTTGLTVTCSDVDGADFLVTADGTGNNGDMDVTGTAVDATEHISEGIGGAVPVTGATEVDLTGVSTAAATCQALGNAVNALLVADDLGIVAVPVAAELRLTNQTAGDAGNVTITETGGTAFALAGMSGGLDPLIGDDGMISTSRLSVGSVTDDVLVAVEAAVAVRDAVYLKSSDLYAKADATAEATMPVAGFIVSKPTATTAIMRRSGDLGGFTLTADTEYYAAKTAGQITATPPAVAGNVVQGVGRAKNATTLTIAVQDDDYTVL